MESNGIYWPKTSQPTDRSELIILENDTQIANAQIKMNRFFSYGIYQFRHWECEVFNSIFNQTIQIQFEIARHTMSIRFLYFCLFRFSRIGYKGHYTFMRLYQYMRTTLVISAVSSIADERK